MNEAHWHLVVNHLPIIFPLVGVIVMITGFVSKSVAVKRTSYLIFIIGAFATIAAMNTGEGAEEVVEKLDGVSENYIETHEESAETFSIVSYILGALSLLGLWASFKMKSLSTILNFITLGFALLVLYFGKETGTTGGEIRHIEIRSGNTIPAIDSENGEHEEHEEHEDDD